METICILALKLKKFIQPEGKWSTLSKEHVSIGIFMVWCQLKIYQNSLSILIPIKP